MDNPSKKRIVEAFHKLVSSKPIENVSTEEIISEAKVSKQTFYKFFKDKYEIAFFYYQYCQTENIKSFLKGGISLYESNVMILEHFKAEKDFYTNLFKNVWVQNSFYSQFGDFCLELFPQITGRTTEYEYILPIYEIYSRGSNWLIMEWIRNGMTEPIEKLATAFSDAMPIAVRKYYGLD